MFFDALWKFLLLCTLLPVLSFIVTISVYKFGSFWMPDWMRGVIARSIIWGRHEKLSKKFIVIVAASTIISIILWSNTWLWTLIIGVVILVPTWYMERNA